MNDKAETKDYVVIDPTQEPISDSDVTDALISLTGSTDRLDLYILCAELAPLDSTELSSEIYAVRAPSYKLSDIKKKLNRAYPDSYDVAITSLPQAVTLTEDSCSVEYKKCGDRWAEDILTPLAPTGRTGQGSGMEPVTTSQLHGAFETIREYGCLGIYHIVLRSLNTEKPSYQLFKDVAEYYERGPMRSDEIVAGKMPKQNATRHEDQMAAAYVDAIRDAPVVEADPRFLITGSNAEEAADIVAGCFDIRRSRSDVEGVVCTKRRVPHSISRAYPAEDSTRLRQSSKWLREKLRSPRFRPGIKRLTRNQSSRFPVSEIALGHFISAETKSKKPHEEPIYRRPPTTVPSNGRTGRSQP